MFGGPQKLSAAEAKVEISKFRGKAMQFLTIAGLLRLGIKVYKFSSCCDRVLHDALDAVHGYYNCISDA
jgi:hypothetical protein